jgi:hypothetical protein
MLPEGENGSIDPIANWIDKSQTRLNTDHELSCTEAEETAAVLKAAAGELTEEQWTAWIAQVVIRPRRN